MTKTINILALEYSYNKVVNSPYNEYKAYSFVKQKELTRFDGYDIEQAYEDGANAVLEEFRKLLQVSQIRSYHEVYDDIVELVKRLKGE